jgi:glycerol-3-phosphate cytidylyltransferase
MEIEKYEIGIIAGNFDVIHPGYVRLFKEMNDNCQKQYILLQDDPTIERPEKLKPILTTEERKEMLEYFFNKPTFLTYNTETELKFLIQSINPDVRFLGDDYLEKPYTGDDLGIPIHWISRSHGWSTTKFKKQISKSI